MKAKVDIVTGFLDSRTFLNQFSTGSVMGFLVLGPMIDVKNMLVLLSSFRNGFVIILEAYSVVPRQCTQLSGIQQAC